MDRPILIDSLSPLFSLYILGWGSSVTIAGVLWSVSSDFQAKHSVRVRTFITEKSVTVTLYRNVAGTRVDQDCV